MVVDRNTHRDVGVRTVLLRVALQQVRTQRRLGLRKHHIVAFVAHGTQRGVERSKDVEIGRGTGGPAVGRKVEEHHGNFALGNPGFTQGDQFGDAGRQGFCPVVTDVHVLGAGCFETAMAVAALTEFAGARGASAEDGGAGRAVQLWDRDLDRRLDRHQPAARIPPLFQTLELDGLGSDVGNIERGQHLFGRLGVVVGGAAHQGETGQRDHGIDRRSTVAQEKGFDRRALVEADGEGRHDLQSLCLQCCNGAIVVTCIARQDVRAHQQQPDPASALRRLQARKLARLLGDAPRQSRVVESQVRVVERRLGRQRTAQAAARTGRVAVDQKADEMHDVMLGSGQPVLQRQEVGAHVLRRAGNEA